MVDCYKTEEQNVLKLLLEKEGVQKIDFVCWTHPHDDHTVGLDEIWSQYCTEETRFCCTDIIPEDSGLYSAEAMAIFEDIKNVHKSRKIKKLRIMSLKDSTLAEKLQCAGNANRYEFKIQSFAPNSAILGERLIGNKEEKGNVEKEDVGEGYGIIKTIFDILEQNEFIETELIGEATVYKKEIAG